MKNAHHKSKITLFLSAILSAGFLFLGCAHSESVSAITSPQLLGAYNAGLPSQESGIFSQNNLTFWNPYECESGSGSGGGASTGLDATGDWSAILSAKNADKSFFNGSGDVPSARWNDGNTGEMKTLLETYGDLAYQLGRTIGAPWVAILVQMRYEEPDSNCGRNNFWGNGCPEDTPVGGASVQGKNLGEGFAQYGQTLTKICATVGITDPSCQEQFKVSDPKRYLELIGPFWVQGDPNGAGYWYIEDAKRSIDSLLSYINTPEGQSIVKGFTNYAGMDYTSSSTPSTGASTPASAPTSTPAESSGGAASSEDGSNVTIIGDSMTQYDLEFYDGFIKQKLPNSDIHYQNGKSFKEASGSNPGGLTILKELADQGKLRKILVFALGSNNGPDSVKVTQSDIDKLLDYAKSCDKIILLTNYKSSDEHLFDNNNELFKKAADSNDKVILVDWKGEASKDSTKYLAQNECNGSNNFCIHPSKEGSKLWADLIYNAIANADNCTTFEGEYPDYNQAAEPWGSGDYGCTDDAGNWEPFSWCSCGPSSMAMLATVAAGQDIFPNDVADLTKGTKYYWDTTGPGMVNLDKIVGEKYGFEVVEVSASEADKSDVINKMRQYLNDGYMLHFSGQGGCPYPSAHYVGIFSIDSSDNVKLANSAFQDQCSKEMSLSDVVNNGYHGGAFSAIKGTGSNKTCTSKDGDPICDGGSGSGGGGDSGGGTISTGGLTEAQAEKLSQYYNDGGGTSAGNLTDRMNCFAFSMWWITNFTDVIPEGQNPTAEAGVQTGDQLAGWIGETYNLPMGDYNEPRPYAIFSTTAGGVMNGEIHTGVVTAVHDDGTIDFVDAWYPPPGKMASVYTNITPIPPTTYVYLDGHVDMDKLKSVVGG